MDPVIMERYQMGLRHDGVVVWRWIH